ncbi:MAG: Osmosensitive channel His kinase sensor [Acidimicrobiales bacterium]|nr:Osmosensitive channel His kinase sensor [Acidimicrobiales bacterium]
MERGTRPADEGPSYAHRVDATVPAAADADGRAPRPGRLRIYLGAAPGVGKTYAMLNEGVRRAERGTDVAVAYVETHARRNTTAQLHGLEVVPRRSLTYQGQAFEEMDLDAVLARNPDVALVDELAHTNVPGSRHEKRWEDVAELLASGIDVITTVNVQHLESLNDVVERITGITQRETVPDRVVRAADQVELVDMTPEALRRRMAHGNIYAPDKIDVALGNYFRVGNLTALRELALLWLADKVDDALQGYLDQHGISSTWEARERVVVAVTGAPSGAHLIRRAARIASRAKGDLIGVHIRTDDGLATPSTSQLEEHRRLLETLGGTYHEVIGADVRSALVRFARAEHGTQLVLGASRRSRWRERLGGSVVSAVVRAAGDMDVHVISDETPGDAAHRGTRSRSSRRRRDARLSLARRRAGWGLVAAGLPLLTLALASLRHHVGLPGDLMVFTLLVVAVAATGGLGPACVAAALSGLIVNWYFTPPLHTLSIAELGNTLALIAYLIVGVVVSLLVSSATRRSAEAARARSEAEALARVAAGLVGHEDPLPSMVDRVRSTFELDAVALFVRDGDGWRLEHGAGEPLPGSPEQARAALPIGEDAMLALVGPPFTADDHLVLQAFLAQLATALERRQLRVEAASAAVLGEADALRTALLRAVSHDLRTPLSSIKASVTSLLQRDVTWSERDRDEFLTTIDEEADRLDELVGNLLDMSRLQSGALDVLTRAVGWEEVVAAALASLSCPIDGVVVDVAESLPDIVADAALLERAVANVVANAIDHAGQAPVRIEAGTVGDRVDLRVIDRGPGIPPDQRARMFEPFQRLGDGGGDGVGLGLAVARGFVEAMGGQILIDDTPGGGLTLVLGMPRAAPTDAGPAGPAASDPGVLISPALGNPSRR